jgi:hypothetical protein
MKPRLAPIVTTSTFIPLSPDIPPSATYDLKKGNHLNEKVKEYLSKHKTVGRDLGTAVEPNVPARLAPKQHTKESMWGDVDSSTPADTLGTPTNVFYMDSPRSPMRTPGPEDLWSPVSVSFEREDVSTDRLKGTWHMNKK